MGTDRRGDNTPRPDSGFRTQGSGPPQSDSPLITHRSAPVLAIHRLGRVAYQDAWELQNRLVRQRKAGEVPDTLLLLEHPPVFTIGRRGSTAHVLGTPEQLAAIGAEVVQVDRGGDITYHGPGQLVGYPILQLTGADRDAHAYLRGLEEVIIRVLEDFGVAASRREGATGVWVAERKIASIGVRLSSWVTNHGFALNVCPDLSHFELIVPCGLHGVSMTSLAAELGETVAPEAITRRTVTRFREVFGY